MALPVVVEVLEEVGDSVECTGCCEAEAVLPAAWLCAHAVFSPPGRRPRTCVYTMGAAISCW